MLFRRPVLILNGVGLLTCAVAIGGFWLAWNSQGTIFGPFILLTMIGAGLLLIAEILLWLPRAHFAVILMYLGGLLTLPAGLFSILAARMARRGFILSGKRASVSLVCLRCGYDLRTVTIPRCPECGCAIGFDKTFEEMGVTEDELRTQQAASPHRRQTDSH